MSRIYFNCTPFDKGDVTLALESGVDGVIVPREHVQQVAGLSRCTVWAAEETPMAELHAKADEEAVLQRLLAGERVVLARGWEVIPVENLLAQSDSVLAEAATLDEARLAAGILERGVAGIIVSREAVADLKTIVAQCKMAQALAAVAAASAARGRQGVRRLRGLCWRTSTLGAKRCGVCWGFMPFLLCWHPGVRRKCGARPPGGRGGSRPGFAQWLRSRWQTARCSAPGCRRA